MNKQKYPKYNGKPLTKKQKELFDFYKMKFLATIKLIADTTYKNQTGTIEEDEQETIAWNCAYEVITSNPMKMYTDFLAKR